MVSQSRRPESKFSQKTSRSPYQDPNLGPKEIKATLTTAPLCYVQGNILYKVIHLMADG